ADEAVKLEPNEPVNYTTRAAVMRGLSRNDDAVADLRKALTLNPGEARKRQIESALRELGAAPQLLGTRPYQQRTIGRNQARKGRAPGKRRKVNEHDRWRDRRHDSDQGCEER